jgi:hypothetical protein
MANPTTYASARQYIGLAVETTQGTAVVPAVTMPVAKFDPADTWVWIDDTSLRGSMTEPYNRVQGPGHTEFDLGGPAYFDTLGYLLNNIFGDITYSGTYTGSGTTTLNSAAAANDTTISTVASIAALTVIQIDTGVSSEVRTVSSVTGAGPYTLTLNSAVSRAHSGGVVVKPITTPYSQLYNVLNTGNGQPSSMTITDYQGPTASTGTRAYPGCCLSELSLKGTPDSTAITYEAKGMGWPSASAAAFVSAPSSIKPQPAWETQVGLAGTVSGAPILTINDFGLSIKRELKVYDTAQNSTNPYTIFRGKLTVSGSLNFVVANETPLTYLNSNTQPQLQIIVSNGLSGASLLSMQWDLQAAAWTTSKIQRGNPAVEYAVEFDSIANTTNVGFSGGFGPLSITMQNAVAANTF